MIQELDNFTLNDEQKRAAFCEENAVVAAGAGSGKTMVLANRFLWLLTEKDYKIDEILTLTFTKKAAAQMFKRIHRLITDTAENETGIKAKRAKAALDDFIHARIQTLDSYASSIVKQCAHEYGISPDFKIDQKRCYDLALEISYPFLISHRRHPAVERLYSSNSPDSIARDIFAKVLIEYCRIDIENNFKLDLINQFNIIASGWDIYCDKIKNLIKNIEADISENSELLPTLVPVMQNKKEINLNIPDSSKIEKYLIQLLEINPESCIKKAESHPIQKNIITFLYYINSIASVSLKGGKRSDNTVKDAIKQLQAIFDEFFSLAVSCMQAGFNISITSLMTELCDLYISKKRAESVLTFRDIAYLSRTILINQKDIRQSEKESFKAVMIDEFQDNNDLQKDTLFLLAEKLDTLNDNVPSADELSPGKLFFVGDEKQSIYLFRNADVSVFRKLKDELKTADLSLKINYRSAPALIGAFNTIFGGGSFDPEGKSFTPSSPSVFAQSPSLPLFEASYSPLEAGISCDGKLSLCVFDNKKQNEDYANSSGSMEKDEGELLSADENEACFVAKKIRSLLDGKKYKSGDFAVLFRTRKVQHLFEKHLRRLDIPYFSDDINNLFYAGPVNDILSVLKLISHPFDRAAYSEMLRSPFTGLSLCGTTACLSNFNDRNRQPFNDASLEFLDESDKEKYLYGMNVYRSIAEKAGSESISSLVSMLWYSEGYRYETEWNSQLRVYSELYDYFFHHAVIADRENMSLASFTDTMCMLRDSGESLPEINIPAERSGAVQLMTIHKSKGLEFPVVFLCGCGRKTQSERAEAVYFSDETGAAFSPPVSNECKKISGKRNNYFYQRSKEREKQKRTAELRRLLYVGMTRAERELYITGSLSLKKEDEENFTAALINYTEEKCAKKENAISGDTIINDDTFFGLLLPSIISRIKKDENSLNMFNLEEIPSYTENFSNNDRTDFINSKQEKENFIKIIQPVYDNAKVIRTPVIYDNHITPVSVKNEGKIFANVNLRTSVEYSGEGADDIFKEVDLIISRYAKDSGNDTEKINSASFGTIAHICVESLFKNNNPVIPSAIAGFITPSENEILLEAGKKIAMRFIKSPLGLIAGRSPVRHNELPFRSIKKNNDGIEVFINGTIDLFFEEENHFYIVDFKTDSHEAPEEHLAQMACYHDAVNSFFAERSKKECRIWLYYLRTGHAVEATESIKYFKLENILFS